MASGTVPSESTSFAPPSCADHWSTNDARAKSRSSSGGRAGVLLDEALIARKLLRPEDPPGNFPGFQAQRRRRRSSSRLLRGEQCLPLAAIEELVHLHCERPRVQQTQQGHHLAGGPTAGAGRRDLPAQCVQAHRRIVRGRGDRIRGLLDGQRKVLGVSVRKDTRVQIALG